MKSFPHLSAVLVGFCLLAACQKDKDANPGPKVYQITPGPNAQQEAITAMIDVQTGEIIEFGEGTFNFDRSLVLKDKEGVIVRGKGRDKTILNFKNQAFDAEGMKVTGKSLLLEDFTIQDPPGDGIKIENTDGLTLRNLGAVWTADADSTNGAYGLYPVKCTNVLIEDCYAKGASDAGIYVGQSDRVIVSNSLAERNVSGIEIENTSNAEVFNCTASHNTAGILVFDLPNLPKKNGDHVRVYHNTIIDNNTPNFARPGAIVGQVPAGTGILVMATKHVEVSDNDVTNNNVIGTGVISYLVLSALNPKFTYNDPAFNPFTGAVYIHDNRFTSQKQMPGLEQVFGMVLANLFGDDCPDILYDGLRDPAIPDADFCFRNNGNADFANMNVTPAGTMSVSRDMAPFDCTRPAIPQLKVDSPQ